MLDRKSELDAVRWRLCLLMSKTLGAASSSSATFFYPNIGSGLLEPSSAPLDVGGAVGCGPSQAYLYHDRLIFALQHIYQPLKGRGLTRLIIIVQYWNLVNRIY